MSNSLNLLALEALNSAGVVCNEKGWGTWDCQSAMAWAEHVRESAHPFLYTITEHPYISLIIFTTGVLTCWLIKKLK